jgi:hypothetical protein
VEKTIPTGIDEGFAKQVDDFIEKYRLDERSSNSHNSIDFPQGIPAAPVGSLLLAFLVTFSTMDFRKLFAVGHCAATMNFREGG